jgi:hypothetical protein
VTGGTLAASLRSATPRPADHHARTWEPQDRSFEASWTSRGGGSRHRPWKRCGQGDARVLTPPAPPGQRKGLHGHGLRERSRDPRRETGHGDPARPPLPVPAVRRRRDGSSPRDCALAALHPERHRLGAGTLRGLPAVRAGCPPQHEPVAHVGAGPVRRRISLRRWVAAVRDRRLCRRLPRPPGGRTARQAAAQIAIRTAAHVCPTLATLPVPARAFFGAVQAGLTARHRAPTKKSDPTEDDPSLRKRGHGMAGVAPALVGAERTS